MSAVTGRTRIDWRDSKVRRKARHSAAQSRSDQSVYDSDADVPSFNEPIPSVQVQTDKVKSVVSEAPSAEASNGGGCIPPALGFSSHSLHSESSSPTESLPQLRSDSRCPLLASMRMFSRSAGTSIRHSNRTTQTSRSAATTAFPSVSRKSPYASSDCVATLKRFAGQAGFLWYSGWPTCPLWENIY